MSEQRQLAQREYAYGQAAFEGGRYREAVSYFEKAVALAKPTTALGGEIQTWLMNAYSAVGNQEAAIALGQQLSRHPDTEIRKQGKSLLYILQAPRLQRRQEWTTQIPDLGAIATRGEDNSGAYARPTPVKKRPRKKEVEDDQPIDWSQINTADNGFAWLALVAAALIVAGLVWLA